MASISTQTKAPTDMYFIQLIGLFGFLKRIIHRIVKSNAVIE